MAEQQLQETGDRISVGVPAETGFAAARTEVAFRREALINAASSSESLRLKLLRLLNPPGNIKVPRVGRATALLVAGVQRDLLYSQISEIQAVVNYLNSLVELFRLEGSLLQRRAFQPGALKYLQRNPGGGFDCRNLDFPRAVYRRICERSF